VTPIISMVAPNPSPVVSRIYLSPPHMDGVERELLLRAFDSNWIAPVGPDLDAFECEFAAKLAIPQAVALSSGTAALHLALVLLGVQPGDDVIVPTLTFVASANAVTYVGARPVFLDSDDASWNIDPSLLSEELRRRARVGRLPKAVIAVDLYGQCADYDRISLACRRYEVPLIEDAAEALGASYGDAPAGTLGDIGIFSFNGNKIITTSGGGMLVSSRSDWVNRARHLSTQAREPAPHYEHAGIGYNYRLSNLLAAIGRGQLARLEDRVDRRRANNAYYRRALAGSPGVAFMPDASYGRPTSWLTCITIDPASFGATNEDVRLRLEARDIESRPTWKPMHLQPAFSGCPMVGGAVSNAIFAHGLCLPSGSSLKEDELHTVCELIRSTGAGS